MQVTAIPAPVFRINISAPKISVIMCTPVLRDYYGMVMSEEPVGYAELLTEKYGDKKDIPFTETTAAEFLENYSAALKEYREKNADVMMIPEKRNYLVDAGKAKKEFPMVTALQHLVYEYSGLDFSAQLDMIVTEYWIISADAVKHTLSQTEKGREYLEDAYIDMHATK